jgi:hypothetical protein
MSSQHNMWPTITTGVRHTTTTVFGLLLIVPAQSIQLEQAWCFWPNGRLASPLNRRFAVPSLSPLLHPPIVLMPHSYLLTKPQLNLRFFALLNLPELILCAVISCVDLVEGVFITLLELLPYPFLLLVLSQTLTASILVHLL